MVIRAALTGKSRLFMLTLVFFWNFSAQAASFDCQKAATPTERAICADSALSGQDQTIAEHYQQLVTLLPEAEKNALRNEQRSWLKQRNTCASDSASLNACLAQRLNLRDNELLTRLHQAQVALDAVIATIPTTPAQAAVQLRRYGNTPLAAAWLVYLHQFIPTSGVSQQDAQRAENTATTALAAQDSFAASILQDTRKDPKTSRNEAVLMLLRMTIEMSGYDADDRPYVHCFVFARQGDEAYQAFGPLYGSSRDGSAPICAPQGGLFKQEAWRQLRNQLTAPESAVSANAGTIRFASFAAWRILALRATLSPQSFLKPGQSPEQNDDPAQRIRDWTDEKNWPATQRQLTLAAIEPAQQATSQWLQLERGFSAADAPVAAQNIVRQWLNQHLDYLEENSDSE